MILIDVDAVPHDLSSRGRCVDPRALSAATGWVLKPEGLCRDEVCRPLLGRDLVAPDGWIDLDAWADALGLLVAWTRAEEVAAAGRPGYTPT